MKIESSIPTQQLIPDRNERAKTASSGFNEHMNTQEKVLEDDAFVPLRGDRANLSSKSLAVSAALSGMSHSSSVSNAGRSGGLGNKPSSSIVSSQAEPYLSADEVSFFEKLIHKTSMYTSTGAYSSGMLDGNNGSFAFKV